jgi:hypothetical protein
MDIMNDLDTLNKLKTIIDCMNTFGRETAQWMDMAYKTFWMVDGVIIMWLCGLTWLLCRRNRG